MEEWRDVVGFEDYFKVSNLGRVFSKRTNKILKQTMLKTGYASFATRIGGRKGQTHCFRVHILVAKAFISNPENKAQVNHINGIKTDNRLDNLEWVTASENMQHAYKSGLVKRNLLMSNDNPKIKLTEADVLYILEVYVPRHREFGARALARKLGVGKTCILSVVHGKRKGYYN